ncbi:NusG domain II-containing protein [Clostridium sp.]|uniref:NusG domain II-containing protein n=1 Tax=Clostridium sp. TaxID=1506 RepID=UPI002FC8A169
MKLFKKLDIVIIVFLVILSFTPHFILGSKIYKNYSSTYASIKISGNLYDNIPLSSFKGEKTITIDTPHGSNKLLIKDNTVHIIEADCTDELCVKQGTISRVSQSLVCLPHELIIEIKGDESNSDDIILSH